jgi:hypothetical protein
MNRWKSHVFMGCTTLAAALMAAPSVMAQDAHPAPAGGSDHDMFVGHMAFGWFGTRGVPVGPGTVAAPALQQTPVVGIRYWATPMIGIDGGIGFFTTSSSTNTQPQPPGMTLDGPSATTFVLHAGVPLALANSNHFSFQITPELDVGIGSGTIHNMAPVANTDLSGFLLQVGARAGGEVYFGFIGIPQLALDASVGLALVSSSGKATMGAGSTKVSSLTVQTANVSQPWDIFRTNIAVRYYF